MPWIKIATVVGKTLEATNAIDPDSLDDVLQADAEARIKASEIAEAIAERYEKVTKIECKGLDNWF